jgi:hypothetical protein
LERLETWPYDQQDNTPPDRDRRPHHRTTAPPHHEPGTTEHNRRVEMDTTTARAPERSALAAETRTSAFLLGGALGSMGLFAVLLLVMTSWLAR